MENSNQLSNLPPFNESEWIRLLFLLNDTQLWMNELVLNACMQLPMKDRKKLFRKTYYITVTALAHILQRHYYKISRHPASSKFTIPVLDLLCYLRDAASEPADPIPATLNRKRTLAAAGIIGIDRHHVPTNLITVLTDAGGRIITAFPGAYQSNPHL
jgi:hypothetical protein